jgi:hypothetical protein
MLSGDRTTFSMNISLPSLGLMSKQVRNRQRKAASWFLLALLFNLEDGGSMFF